MEDSKGMGSDLRQVVTITPEQFEKLYLSPKGENAGELRKTFANPTPVAIMGFIVALTPISCAFMGWRGSGANGIGTTTDSIFFGGGLLVIAGFLEFILGNTFPSVVFFGYGAHFFTFGTTFVPAFNVIGGTATASAPNAPSVTFYASYGFYLLSMTLLSFIFLICSLRTNVVFVLVFLSATMGFGLATGAFWQLSAGDMSLGANLIVGTGACFFAASMFGWYLLLAIMLGTMDLPSLPVFDLSTKIKGVSEMKKHKQERSDASS